MPYSNISQELTPAQYDAIVVKINELKVQLPFLINLTPEERQSLPKMGDSKQPFVTKALQYAQSFPQIAPPFISLPELAKDRTLALTMLQLIQLLKPFVESLEDTQMAVGSEAYVASLSIYNSAGQAAKANVAGAGAIYDDLKSHFEQGSTPTPTPPPNP